MFSTAFLCGIQKLLTDAAGVFDRQQDVLELHHLPVGQNPKYLSHLPVSHDGGFPRRIW